MPATALLGAARQPLTRPALLGPTRDAKRRAKEAAQQLARLPPTRGSEHAKRVAELQRAAADAVSARRTQCHARRCQSHTNTAQPSTKVCFLFQAQRHPCPPHPPPAQSGDLGNMQERINGLQAAHRDWRAAIAGLQREVDAKQAALQALPPPPDHIAAIQQLDAEANKLYQQVGAGRQGPWRGGLTPARNRT